VLLATAIARNSAMEHFHIECLRALFSMKKVDASHLSALASVHQMFFTLRTEIFSIWVTVLPELLSSIMKIEHTMIQGRVTLWRRFV
jgi:hypothetical protein